MPTTTTNRTTKLSLSQYVNSDVISFLTNYNSDMAAIDNAIGAANGIAGLNASGKLSQMPSASDVGAVPTSLKINGYTLTSDRTLTSSDVGAATTAQGAKADSAIQGIQGNGTDLTPDSNKKVNVTLSGLGGIASSLLGVASGVATLGTDGVIPVSQSGIISGGSTGNRSIKFPDGTLICIKRDQGTATLGSSWGSMYEGNLIYSNTLWPVQFVGDDTTVIPTCHTGTTVNGNTSQSVLFEGVQFDNTRLMSMYIMRPVSGTVVFDISYVAIGRWK